MYPTKAAAISNSRQIRESDLLKLSQKPSDSRIRPTKPETTKPKPIQGRLKTYLMVFRRPLFFPPTGIQSKVQYLSLIQYKETVMRGIKSVALLCTLALGAPAFSAGLTKTLPGDLTTAQAQAVVQASMKKAREIKVPMNIAVMDAGGNLKAFARMDDAFIGSIDIAQKKAKTARYFNMSTRDLGKASQPGGDLYGIEVTNDGLVIFPGGVLLVDKNGVIVGSVGVSGGSVDEDESVAKAGAAVLSGS